MQTNSPDEASVDPQALAWARTHVAADVVERVRVNDWATTYRLSAGEATTFLKVVPGQRTGRLPLIAAIAEHFPGLVPPVVAFDADRGWLLTAHHGGQPLAPDEEEPEVEALLRTLAQIQVRASAAPGFLQAFDVFDPLCTPAQLQAFLEFEGAAEGSVDSPLGAAHFLGTREARRYARLFRSRLPVLARHIASATGLPATLVHGDPHTDNAGLREDGSCILFDWDEAVAGPAGSCLHALFDSCAAAILLSRWAATGRPMDTPEGRLLAVYVRLLAAGGYATQKVLIRAMPGAICAGVIRFLLGFGHFPHSLSDRRSVRAVRRLLDSLLDLCDWLSAKDPVSALAFAADYEGLEEWPRAQRMLQDQVARFPDRADLLGRYGMLARRAGDLATAQEACLEAARIEPQRADFQLELARVALDRLDLPASRAALQAALALDPGAAGAAALGVRIMTLAEVLRRAAQPGGWPRWTISPDERARGRVTGDTLALIVHLFREHGVVQLDGVFDADTIASLHQALLQSHPPLFVDAKQADALRDGDKRRVSTVTMDPVLGAPDFVASGLFLAVLHQLLGEECILGAYTAEVALPGSEARSPRKGLSALFPEAAGSLVLPPVAARVIVPLVRMDETNGTVRVFTGTRALSADEADQAPGHDPVLPPGSCLLLDQALVCQRLGNASSEAQAVLNLQFSRPWHREPGHDRQAPPLRFAPAYFERASAELRQLVGWWDLELRRVAQALGQGSA